MRVNHQSGFRINANVNAKEYKEIKKMDAMTSIPMLIIFGFVGLVVSVLGFNGFEKVDENGDTVTRSNWMLFGIGLLFLSLSMAGLWSTYRILKT